MLRPLRIRDFALLWTGLTVSLLGDGIFFVAIAWQVFELSDSPTTFGLVSAAWSLPLVIFVLAGGVATDRFDRRKVMIGADVTRGVAVLAMGALTLSGDIEIWHLIALSVVYGTGQAFFGPALGAIVPDIVPPHLLVEANSLDNVMRPAGERLIGPAVGGFLVAFAGAGAAFLVDAASFAFSAIVIGLIKPRPLTPTDQPRSAAREVKEGFAYVRSKPWLWVTLLSAAFGLLFALGPFQVLVPYLIKYELGGGAEDVGFMFAAGGVGAILAAIVMGQRDLPRRHITVMFLAWAAAFGSLVVYAALGSLWQVFVVEFFAWGLFTIGIIVWSTLLHSLVPQRLLGRVTSFDWLVSASLFPLSFALCGPVSEWIGLDETFLLGGVVSGLIGAAALFAPGVRDTEDPEVFEQARREKQALSPLMESSSDGSDGAP